MIQHSSSDATPDKDVSLALWAVNLARPMADMRAWIDALEHQAEAADRLGRDMLVLPEYACAQWLHRADAPTDETRQIAWMADQAETLVDHLGSMAVRHGIDILAGSMPWRNTGRDRRITNRAILARRDGSILGQDKLSLTPGERDPAAWTLDPGHALTVFDWQGWRVAVVICLDIEQPALAAKLAPLAPDLIIVPSMTSGATGYHRVHVCARARAVELMTVVAVVGTVGTLPDGSTNNGGAAVYGPCEPGICDDGVLAATGRLAAHFGPGPVLGVDRLPLGAVRGLRSGGAEVWSGPFDAASVSVGRS